MQILQSQTVEYLVIARWLITFVFLIANAWKDLRTNNIYWGLTLVILAIGFILQCLSPYSTLCDFLWGIVLGGVVLVFSIITKGAIGLGDGWMILAMGLMVGGAAAFMICILASCGAGLAGLFLMNVKKKRRTYEIPFVPFLLGGAICYGILVNF